MKVWKTEKVVYFKPKIQKKTDIKSISNSNINSNNNPNNNIKIHEQNLDKNFLLKKRIFPFKVEKYEENLSDENENNNSGRWTLNEHILFLQALDKFGMKWKKFKKMIKTRTGNQIRSHCQKFFTKLKNCKDEELGIDFTLNNIHNMDDIIKHIKSVNKNYDVVNVLLYISGKYSSNSDTRKSNKISKALDVNNIFEQDIKSNTNNEINFNEILGLNEVNKLIEETRNKQQLINNNLGNSNNSFRQNWNFCNNSIYNLIHNYIKNSMIMNFVNNINNIKLVNNIQNLNNIYVYNDNQKNSLNEKISEKNSTIKNNNDNDCHYINNIKNLNHNDNY
jgi:SHAQKYF class myb-like DNA-binding protein